MVLTLGEMRCSVSAKANTGWRQKGFTLIELLVVVAIIGILAAVGVVAYSGYTSAAKRNATLAQHRTAVKFIQNTLGMCDVNGGGTLKISDKRSINCNITNGIIPL